MYKKYTAPCPLMGRGAAERRLEWLSQQKHYNVCLGDKGTIGSSFFPRWKDFGSNPASTKEPNKHKKKLIKAIKNFVSSV